LKGISTFAVPSVHESAAITVDLLSKLPQVLPVAFSVSLIPRSVMELDNGVILVLISLAGFFETLLV